MSKRTCSIDPRPDEAPLRLCLQRCYSIPNHQPPADMIRLALRLSRIGAASGAASQRPQTAIDRPMATMPSRLMRPISMAGW